MRRREFITLFGSAAATWPLDASAQQSLRRIGVLMGVEQDARGQARYVAFQDTLANLGWHEGRNVSIIARWGQDEARIQANAAELVAMRPDVIVAAPAPAVQPLQQLTKSIPIVFAQTADPVGLGLVESLAHPGGNITGFAGYDFAVATKWIELLKQIAPSVGRAAVISDPRTPTGPPYLTKIQTAAHTLGVDVLPFTATDAAGVESAFMAFAQQPNVGFIMLPSGLAVTQRELVVSLAAKYRVPGIYAYRYYPEIGGLASYGVDDIDDYKRAGGYVDRILKGEKPVDLPVQYATKFQLVINLKTAKTLGLTISPAFLLTADEVIE
jgi:putative tryptophan/tyrosine transport system substrate-binding protein